MAKRRPSGDGMVRKRKDGRWEGRIVVGHKSNGDSIFRYLSAGSQKELLAKLHRNIEEYRDVDLREESKMPLGEWLDRWLEEYAAPSVRPSTLEGYRGYVERNIKPRLGNKPVGKITVEDIRQLYRELQEHGRQEEHPQYGYKLAGSTIRRIHGVLHEVLDAAAQENLIARNPTDGITLPRKKAAPKQVLNNAQLERFMTAIQEDKVWHDFFYTELTTGLRRGEICGLMWQDFDEKAGTLKILRSVNVPKAGELEIGETKTSQGRRTIRLPPSTVQRLKERRKHAILKARRKNGTSTAPRSLSGRSTSTWYCIDFALSYGRHCLLTGSVICRRRAIGAVSAFFSTMECSNFCFRALFFYFHF